MFKEFFIIFCLSILIAKSFNITSNERGIGIIANGLSCIMRNFYSTRGSNLHIVTSVSDENRSKLNEVLEVSLKSLGNSIAASIEDVKFLKPIKNHRRPSSIFIVDSIENFDKICQHVKYDNFKMRTLFTVVSIEILSDKEMKNIFDCFMSRLVVSVNILALNESQSLNLFTFFPFSEGEECKNTNIVKINSFDATNNAWENENFFPKKSRNLQNCPLVVGVAEKSTEPAIIINNDSNGKRIVSGIEYEIFAELSKRLNFDLKLVIFNESVGAIFPNGTGNGVLVRTLRREVEVTLGLVSLQLSRTLIFSETRYYSMHSLGLVVPPGEEFGELEKLLRPFTKAVWIGIIIVFLLFTIVTIICLKYPKAFNFIIGRGVTSPVLNIIAQHLGVSQPTLPSRNFARFILMQLMIYCLIMRSSYQGAVFNTLISHDKKAPVQSISEIMERQFTLYIYETLASRIEVFPSYKNRKVYLNSDIHVYRNKTLESSFKGAVFNYDIQIFYLNQKNYKNFTFVLCKEKFLTSSFVFYFNKNHYLVDDVNLYLEMMHSNGFIDFISSKYADKNYIKNVDTGPKVLELFHLYGAFKIYLIANLIAFIVFVFEVTAKHLMKAFKIIFKRKIK